jgi:hypothetical protein
MNTTDRALLMSHISLVLGYLTSGLTSIVFSSLAALWVASFFINLWRGCDE